MLEGTRNLNYTDRIKNFITECEIKGSFHKINAKNSLRWYNFLGIFNVVLSASQALVMTIQSVYNNTPQEIAITGGVFAFAITVFNRVQMSFSFNTLAILHNQLSDDFTELCQSFKLLLIDLENDTFDEHNYKILVQRLISIQEKAHIQEIKPCWFLGCFCF